MPAEFLADNHLTLLHSGREYFPALLAEIATAQKEIYLESYIYANDRIGQAITTALCRAAERGVEVRLTVDGFGSRNFPADFLPRMQAAGIRASLYRREIGTFHFYRHRLRRLHRKLIVIDSQIAFIGGINIIDDDNAPADMRPRFDYAVRIEGPILRPIHAAARRLWEIAAWVNFKRRLRDPPAPTPPHPPAGGQRAAFLIRDNIRHRNDILNAYIAAIKAARTEIMIANAYFLPGVRFGLALQAAARRGVKISILLQGKTDHPFLRFATQALYNTALNNKIRIFEYEKSVMHAKVAVIDGEWATVGSSNIDPFSLLFAKEANLVVEDHNFAQQLLLSLRLALADGAREISRAQFIRQPVHWRLLRWFSYGLVRLLVGLVGYGPKHWQADEAKPGVNRARTED